MRHRAARMAEEDGARRPRKKRRRVPGDCEEKHDDHKAEEASEDANDDTAPRYIDVECRQGDAFLINTRLWWHSTFIPTQKDDVPCISYARDVYFVGGDGRRDELVVGNVPSSNSDKSDGGDTANDEDGRSKAGGGGIHADADGDAPEETMTNVDGTYAARDIGEGTVLFTERNMPGCELHRVADPTAANCRVVEIADDGGGDPKGGGKEEDADGDDADGESANEEGEDEVETYMAVVSTRHIKAGEFFCLPESSDEEDDEDGEFSVGSGDYSSEGEGEEEDDSN